MSRGLSFSAGLFLLVLCIAAGCGSDHSAAVEQQVYSVRGRLLGTTTDGRSIVVTHEPIEAAGMEAMTMTFRLRDTTALDDLQTGDKIAFELVVAGGLFAEDIRRLPPNTELNLGIDSTAADSL